MPAIATAYGAPPIELIWTWLLAYAPSTVPILASYDVVMDTPFLQHHFSAEYAAQQAAKEEARKAANAARRAAVNQRQAEKRAQMDRVQAEIDKPMPTVAPFKHSGYQMVGPRAPQRDSKGVLAPWEAPDSVEEKPRRK